MVETWVLFAVGPALVALGIVCILDAERIHRIALRLNPGRYRWEKHVPFGGDWIRTHEKEHLLSIRFSGLVALVMGAVLLYAGILRLR